MGVTEFFFSPEMTLLSYATGIPFEATRIPLDLNGLILSFIHSFIHVIWKWPHFYRLWQDCYFGPIQPLDSWVLKGHSRQREGCTWDSHEGSSNSAMEIPSPGRLSRIRIFAILKRMTSLNPNLAPTLLGAGTFTLSSEFLGCTRESNGWVQRSTTGPCML